MTSKKNDQTADQQAIATTTHNMTAGAQRKPSVVRRIFEKLKPKDKTPRPEADEFPDAPKELAVVIGKEAWENQGGYAGKYILLSKDISDTEVWVYPNGEKAIWYDTKFHNWKIGKTQDFGSSKCVIYSRNCTKWPHEVKYWKYYNGEKFVDSNDITVQGFVEATEEEEPDEIEEKTKLMDEKEAQKYKEEQEVSKELRTAFDIHSNGLDTLPCKEIGYILRTLGQNPTEDEILALVCEANCDWEGELSRNDFLSVAYARVQTQVNRLDDVKAAFRAFDNNGDGYISKAEIKDAILRFGQTFSAEEADEMFKEADLNADGKIDWEEFLQMMIPGHRHNIEAAENEIASTT